MEYNGIHMRHYMRLSASGYTTFLVFFFGSSLCSSDSLLRIAGVSVRFLSRRCSLCSSDSLLRLIRFLAVLHLCLQLFASREGFLSCIYVNTTDL